MSGVVLLLLVMALFVVRQSITRATAASSLKRAIASLDATTFLVLIWLLYLLLLVGYGAAAFRGTRSAWIGGTVLAIGTLLRVWALRTIRGFYSTGIVVFAAHEIVREGPYRFLQHPLTLGLWVEMLGLAVGISTTAGYVLLGAAGPLILWHNQREERFLKRHLGASYMRGWGVSEEVNTQTDVLTAVEEA